MQIKRKTHFVDRSVQGAILLRFALHWGMFVITAGIFLYFVELLCGDPRDAFKSLAARHGPTVLALLVLCPIFLRDLCKLTNRFAGPMVRLRRAMHDLAEGREVAPIHFRTTDYWQELAVDFNQIVERVVGQSSLCESPRTMKSSSTISSSMKKDDHDNVLQPGASPPETETVEA